MSNINTVVQQALNDVSTQTGLNMNFVNQQLDNIGLLLGNVNFMKELNITLDNVLDRDHDGVIDANDIALLKNIFVGKNQAINIVNFVSQLLQSVVLLMGTVSKPLLSLNPTTLSDIFFGVFTYVLYQYVDVSLNTKQDIISILQSVYNYLQVINTSTGLFTNIVNLFKQKGWCKCLCSSGSSSTPSPQVLNAIEKSRTLLKMHKESLKENYLMKQKVDELNAKLTTSTKN